MLHLKNLLDLYNFCNWNYAFIIVGLRDNCQILYFALLGIALQVSMKWSAWRGTPSVLFPCAFRILYVDPDRMKGLMIFAKSYCVAVKCANHWNTRLLVFLIGGSKKWRMLRFVRKIFKFHLHNIPI